MANEAVRTDAVHTVRLLAAGAAPTTRRPAAQTPTTAPEAAPASVKTHEMTSPGYYQTLAAHQALEAVVIVEWRATPPRGVRPAG
ncbi:hypothetical protein [Streptomyces sp. NPDC047071]|uniref:hypothetical protein n=1 Tax=Streptomyces sp. NPDC047071 TaxID=3154808 RepID=UPI00345647E8